jgi:arylsulfatase A-like enzyme
VAAAIALALWSGRSLLDSETGDWNLLLVTLDTTRADHLGVYGYAHIDTPALDALAGEGIRYTRCYATAPLTLPSHASIMTGLLPPRHGVHANGRDVLSDAALTLAEILSQHGYDTGAVVAAFVLDRQFGLAQGFDDYDDDLSRASESPRFSYARRDAEQVTDAALQWLENRGRRSWFLWVHYFDPHAPYKPPGPNPLRTPYDAEIEFVDAQLGRLVESLAVAGAARRTLIVVTADHGEGLWEHGETTHGLFAYDSTLRAPLIIRFPDGRGAGRTVTRPVSVVDLMPSILTWLGRAPPRALDGRPLPLAEDGADTPGSGSRALYFENEGPAHLFGWSPIWGIIEGGHKFIQAPKPELYDLAADPLEERNLYDAADARSREWRSRFEEIMERLEAAPRLRGAPAELSEPGREKLIALGYVVDPRESEGLGGWRTPEGADPKDMVPVYHRLQLAMTRIEQGKLVEGVDELVDIVTSSDPGNRRAATLLAELALEEEVAPRVSDGLKVLLESPSGDPELDLWLRTRLGMSLSQQGSHAEAVEAFRRGLEIDASRSLLHWRLALELELLDAPPEEILPHLERVVGAAPLDPRAHYHVGLAHERLGEHQQALRALRRAAELAGDDASECCEDVHDRIASLEGRR